MRLEAAFGREAFARAFAAFRRTYNVAPQRASCAPDVFARTCELFARAGDAHRHATRLAYEGVPIVAAVLAPGTLALDGEVDETQMGDW
ncbi:MAG: hypothetical protein NVS2B3_00810 [Vulcanimicrobiaceae bacterium]